MLSVTASKAQIKCALTTSRQASFARAITIVAEEDTEVSPARFAVEFEFGSADLTQASQDFLEIVANVIINDDTLKVSAYFIDGHTDAVGSNEANENRGLNRAQTVANFVLARMSDALSFKVRSFGETKLLNAERPKDGVNRRVEITPVATQ